MEVIGQHMRKDQYLFDKGIVMMDGRNIKLGQSTGTKFGTSTTEKLAFYGVTPIVQASNISTLATGGADNDGTARQRVNDVLSLLASYGLMA